jgi:hypothetical protein
MITIIATKLQHNSGYTLRSILALVHAVLGPRDNIPSSRGARYAKILIKG